DRARCTPQEVQYFLEMIGRVFPAIQVAPENIVFRFSGVRPLAASSAKATGQITRDHEIQVVSGEWTGLDFPVYSLVGGKWTSYRAFSEQVTDKALEFLGRSRSKSTRDLAIGGGRGYPTVEGDRKRRMDGTAAWSGLTGARAQALFERYGTRAELVGAFIGRAPDAALESLPSYSRREIAFLAQCEKVVHLDDLLLRRSMLAMLGRLTRPALEEIAGALAESLDWSPPQQKDEVARTLDILRDKHGVEL
ncbi:MAG TPA: glycerol-3-phosphate dehydrogenase C-terminal domain-containing protein, partial [Anaerolineales bacterium]